MNSKLTGLPLLEGCTQLLPSFALLLCAQLMAASPTHAVGALPASAHNSGLKIDHVDYHMGTVFDYPQFREIAEHLASEYKLGMMQYFGEPRHNPQYEARLQDKTDSLIPLTTRLKPGFTLTYRQLIAMQGLKSMRRPEG